MTSSVFLNRNWYSLMIDMNILFIGKANSDKLGVTTEIEFDTLPISKLHHNHVVGSYYLLKLVS